MGAGISNSTKIINLMKDQRLHCIREISVNQNIPDIEVLRFFRT